MHDAVDHGRGDDLVFESVSPARERHVNSHHNSYGTAVVLCETNCHIPATRSIVRRSTAVDPLLRFRGA